MNNTLQVLASIAIVIAVIFGYVQYRKSLSSASHVVQYLTSGTSISPTTCISYGSTGFQGTLSGNLHLDGAKIRAEITKVDSGVTTRAHAISQDSLEFYVWVDETHGTKMTRPDFLAAFDFTKTTLTCTAWWSPDQSVFEMPAFTPFTQPQ